MISIHFNLWFMKRILLTSALFLAGTSFTFSQSISSCDCIVDTTGYDSFLGTLNPDENANFQLHPHGTFAIAYGVIGSTTPSVVQDLIDNHPSVTTIVMYACPGSEDDQSNLQASQLIHNAGYKMYLPIDGWIASGAVDMFVAGSIRVIDATFDPVGVHSWSDGVNEATDFPVGHVNHLPYINYYVSVGFTQQEAEDFYYFTINAAPAAGIHWMTQVEMNQYKIRTCTYSNSPTYLIAETNGVLNTGVAVANYQWIDCSDNSIIPSETTSSYSPSANGQYAVIITEDNCTDTSNCLSFTSASIQEKEEAGYTIFPNPATNLVSFSHEQIIDAHLIDELGRIIKLDILNDAVSISMFSPGVYLLELKDAEKNVYRHRMVISE